ncbi:unnamed protein product [Pleuronectes platessa]|uniref:Uncharacterized protein n=1 Tax=Pleuronectes platessa TaxID=8262 RepID=A0A9N7V6A3_PLEPL|nr:unnamed protein product [Pleuronectes platessa]
MRRRGGGFRPWRRRGLNSKVGTSFLSRRHSGIGCDPPSCAVTHRDFELITIASSGRDPPSLEKVALPVAGLK